MKRDRLAFAVSAAVLATAMWHWFDMFAFSKVVYVPQWASLLPLPPLAGSFVAIPFLIPVACMTQNMRAGCKGVVWAAVVSPVPALVAYALAPSHQHAGLPLNLLVQFTTLSVLGCLFPGSVMLGLRAVFALVTERVTTRSRGGAAKAARP